MKLFFQIALLLLCAGCFSSSAEKTGNDNADKGTEGSESIAAEKPDQEKDVPPFVAPETKMQGDWIGFIQNWNMPTKLTGIRYRFLDSGTWEILEEGNGSEAKPQGWYKIIESENKLLLQPHEVALKEDDNNAAISAALPNEDMFIIPNPLDENNAMTFIREKTLTVPTPAFLVDRWTITQMNPESNEKRVAKYVLILKEDGTYAVEQPDKELPEEWATGTYSISGLRIKLENKYTGDGLWNAPQFFLLENKLWYDDSEFCLWCERENTESSE